MLGFYMTNAGLEQTMLCLQSGEKLAITHVVLGDAGDRKAVNDYSITEVKGEVYRKKLDMSDSCTVKGNKLMIKTTIPDSAGELDFNEVGYLDAEGTLIIYGVIGDVHKNVGGDEAPQTVELENYVQLDQTQIDHITIDLGADSMAELSQRITVMEADYERRIAALEATLTGVDDFLGEIS